VRILRSVGRALLAFGRGVRRLVVLRNSAWVVAVILSFIAFGTSGTVYDTGTLGYGLMFFVGFIVGLPFGLIATRPLRGLMLSVGGAFVLTALPLADRDPWPWLVVNGLVMFALLFATCARVSLPRAIGAWLITAALFAWGLPDHIRTGWLVGVTCIAVLGVLVGRLVSTRQALVVQEEVSTAEKGRRVVLEERARIARDLHDIVAHHMSLVVVQAETAVYRVPELSEGARAELLSIGETARSALAETRTLLSVLRQDDQQLPAAPQPGLQQLGELVEAAQRAGVTLDARIDVDLAVLRPGTSLAAYRIVQEALANASRHAPGARVRLVVDQFAQVVHVLVRNGPPLAGRPTAPLPAGDGHGITGMRERAAAAGGRLTLGPTEDGGFAVELFLSTDEEQQRESSTGSAPSAADLPGRSVPHHQKEPQ
jgi:signal transduction histidine kinase